MAGNVALVLLWHFIGTKKIGNGHFIAHIIALISAATAKFLVLYVGIVKIAIPVFLNLSAQQSAVITTMFSIPQLMSALIGGVIVMMILPVLKKAIGERQG